MSRHDLERLADIHQAIAAIGSHVSRGDLPEALIFDAAWPTTIRRTIRT